MAMSAQKNHHFLKCGRHVLRQFAKQQHSVHRHSSDSRQLACFNEIVSRTNHTFSLSVNFGTHCRRVGGLQRNNSSIGHSCNQNNVNLSHRHGFSNNDPFSQKWDFRRQFSANAFIDKGAADNDIVHNDQDYIPKGVTRQFDFFEEVVTFVHDVDVSTLSSIDRPFDLSQNAPQSTKIGDTSTSPKLGNIPNALSSYDNMSLCILSKGSANTHEGNDGEGPDSKARHATAMAWSELLDHCLEWNGAAGDGETITTVPMMAVAAAAPVIVHGGVQYLHRIDRFLSKARSKTSAPPSMWDMACHAVSFRDAFVLLPENQNLDPDKNVSDAENYSSIPLLSPRERWHLHALYQLMQNNHREAMGAYLRLLELVPGDLLALSLAIDLAYTLGDAGLASRAATTVSSYWTERDGGHLRIHPSQSGQTIANSLLAVGLSSSSSATAERLAELAMARDRDGAGGISVWALSHSYGAEGRTQEMVSKLAGFDGTQFYESCGYLNFHTRMAGYGGIALLDRRGAGSERSALRLYDGGFGRVLDYSGNNIQWSEQGGEDACLEQMKAPKSKRRELARSIFSGLFGNSSETKDPEAELSANDSVNNDESPNKMLQQLPKRTVEDVLCWLPPSPLLLAHATALLFRLTLCDGISPSDSRWADLLAAWRLSLKKDVTDDIEARSQSSIEFMPLALLASSLLIEPDELTTGEVPKPLVASMQGLNKMGKLMSLGEKKPISDSAEEWRDVLQQLAQSRDNCQRWSMPSGLCSSTFSSPGMNNSNGTISSLLPQYPNGWVFDTRQFFEYSICYAALKAGDYESLCLARAICSEGTTLRSNCPELWWRYGMVLDKLGDKVAAENARAASVSLGSGEGARAF